MSDTPDYSHLSARVQAAIALIDSPADLRLRTTLRPDVAVWSSLIVTEGYYESFVVSLPPDLAAAMQAHGVRDCVRYATKDAAERGHEAMCGRVLAVLDSMKARA